MAALDKQTNTKHAHTYTLHNEHTLEFYIVHVQTIHKPNPTHTQQCCVISISLLSSAFPHPQVIIPPFFFQTPLHPWSEYWHSFINWFDLCKKKLCVFCVQYTLCCRCCGNFYSALHLYTTYLYDCCVCLATA